MSIQLSYAHFCSFTSNMKLEELGSDIQAEFRPAPLGAGDMEAVEALMSMTKHWKTRGLQLKHFRPLTPSSDYSEDDSSTLGSTVLQDSPLVSDPYGLRVILKFFLEQA